MEEQNKSKNITISFGFYPEGYTDIYLSFVTNDGLSIYEFHKFCKKFATVMGFSPENIEEIFGEDSY